MCNDVVGDLEQDAVVHQVDDSNDDDDISDDDNRDIGSLFGSLIGSRSNSEVDPNEFIENNQNNLKDFDENETVESEDDKTDSVTLDKSKSNDLQHNDQDSDAESSMDENLLTIDEKLSVLNLNAAEKAIHYREKAMAAISTSQETLNVVKKALSKHASPVPCEICGELMKNIKGVKLHIAKKHKKLKNNF